MDIRMGAGVDVYAFSEDLSRLFSLVCLRWPGECGLEGHSDADVTTYTACDVVLIASSVRNLGTVLGTERSEWTGASDSALLAEAVRSIRADGWATANVSIQIVGQHPRSLPRKTEAEKAMGDVVGAPADVPATTTDRLGLTGRGEGLVAIATALVYRI